MNELENGYVHFDGNGNAHFVSYDSLGSGLVMIFLLAIATIFIKTVNGFLLENKWVIIIPTSISVLIKTLMYDLKIPVYKRIVNIIADAVKTLCMYSILLIIVDECANAHWLDRFLLALFYGALLFAANWLIDKTLNFFRSCQMCVVHLIACLLISTIAICLYSNHKWYWMGYDYTVFLNKASIVNFDERMEGTIHVPEKIYNYTVESIGEGALSQNKKITFLKLPNTVKVIKEDAFNFQMGIQGIYIPKSVVRIEKCLWSFEFDFEIYYEGTQEEWNDIDIQDNNIKELTVHFNCE